MDRSARRTYASDPQSIDEQIKFHVRMIETYRHLTSVCQRRLDTIADDAVDLRTLAEASMRWNEGSIRHHERSLAYLREKVSPA